MFSSPVTFRLFTSLCACLVISHLVIELLSILSLLFEFFKCFRVCLQLTSNGFDVLLGASVLAPDLAEDLANLSKRVDLADFIAITSQELSSDLANGLLLFLAVIGVIDTASVGEGVVHGQFSLKLLDFVVVALNQQVGVSNDID